MTRGRGGYYLLGVLGAISLLLLFIYLPYFFNIKYEYSSAGSMDSATTTESYAEREVQQTLHIKTPEPLKAIYMTSCVAATPKWREELKSTIENTELNALVIDIKDATGVVSFPNNFPISKLSRGCVVSDMGEFIQSLHESDIYVIGRISVFQDPSYTEISPELAVKSLSTGGVWKDKKGLSFIDVREKAYWDYIVRLSLASYQLGFDELNFDYVRYPSDGLISDINYNIGSSTKADILESFFAHLNNKLKNLLGDGDSVPVLSVDLFGMTTTVDNDMGIGQILERALPYFDYISPMVYPSHYPSMWNGFKNPAEHPYDVIKISMTRAVEREREWNILNGRFSFDSEGATTTPASKMRPWLQDFNLGSTYDSAKVRAQIQATYDSGLTSWMLWSAGNKYTTSALLPEN
jgi:hypothetical protein